MSILQSAYLFPPKVRAILAAASGGVVLAACIWAGLSVDAAGGTWIPAVILMTLVYLTLAQRFEHVGPSLPPMPTTFEELSVEERGEALDLAWAEPHSSTLSAPIFVTPELGPVVMGVVTAVVLDLILFVIWQQSNPPPTGGDSMAWTVALLVACAGTGAIVPISQRHRMSNAAVTFELAWKAYLRDAREVNLRRLAVIWVNAHSGAWRAKATTVATEKAIERFGLRSEDTQKFRLFTARGNNFSDMPEESLGIIVLLVGAFLGVRSGFELLVKSTSYEQAKERDILKWQNDAQEMEFHYRDIVTVEYRRQETKGGKELGVFQVSLVDGQKSKYDTWEDNAESAVEAIRKRTRAVKAAGHPV